MKIKRVVFADKKLEKRFNDLSENDPIKKALKRAICDIKENPFCGRNVQKKLVPKKYKMFNNLVIYDLPSAWRMLYAVTSEGKLNILSIVLEGMPCPVSEKSILMTFPDWWAEIVRIPPSLIAATALLIMFRYTCSS